MGILKYYQQGSLALIAASVAAVYGGAIFFPGERQRQAELAWIDLPEVAPPALLASARVPVEVKPLADLKAPPKQPTGVAVATLRDRFDAVSFQLESVRQGEQAVPRLFVATLPHDFKSVAEVGELKTTFFKMVLPLTLKVNEEILGDRHQLLLLHKKMLQRRDVQMILHLSLQNFLLLLI